MDHITTREGDVVQIDEIDFPAISQRRWRTFRSTKGNRLYAMTGHQTLMHRMLLSAGKGFSVDHKNLNGLDNRRENLRLATSSQQHANIEKQLNNTTGFKGVFFCKRDRIIYAKIAVQGKQIRLGTFRDVVSAAKAYDAAALNHFGEFARPNFS